MPSRLLQAGHTKIVFSCKIFTVSRARPKDKVLFFFLLLFLIFRI